MEKNTSGIRGRRRTERKADVLGGGEVHVRSSRRNPAKTVMGDSIQPPTNFKKKGTRGGKKTKTCVEEIAEMGSGREALVRGELHG